MNYKRVVFVVDLIGTVVLLCLIGVVVYGLATQCEGVASNNYVYCAKP
jgi:hypothetical protein